MTIGPRARLSQGTRLALTPGMRTSLAWLRMPAEEMLEALEAEAAENPFLRVRRPEVLGEAYDVALDLTAAGETLLESLARQLSMMRIGTEVLNAALLLVTELREDGYLDAALPDLAADHGVEEAWLEAGLAALQRCEPPGIGARSLAECLALKLQDKGFTAAEAQALVGGIEALAEDRFAPLARRLRLPEARIAEAARLLRGFSPVPVDRAAAPATLRLPEILIDHDRQGRLSVRLNDALYPEVTLAPDLDAARAGSPDLVRLGSRAEAVARAVRARTTTLLRIGGHIAARQSAFFLGGPARLLPESRAEAAAELGIHPTTLGRAIAGKAILSGGAILPMENFFSRALPGAAGPVSAFDVQRRIREIVQAEPPDAPLSDADIHRILSGEGVDIARRTVAKYRKCLRIASSYERRRRRARNLGPHGTKTVTPIPR